MSTFPTPVRIYNFSDARLVDLCIEKCAFAERDETELLTKGVTDVWVADLLARALAFAAAPSDAIERAEQSDATDIKNEAADDIRDKAKELRSTAARAFGVKSGNYKKFALHNIDNLSADELHTVALAAKGVAVTFAVQLATKGWEATDTTELQDLCDAYVEARKTQNIETGDRDNKQEARVIEGNAIYDLLQNQLCEAGKEYWRTVSASKYNDYLIHNNASGSPAPNVTVSGILTSNATGLPIADAVFQMGPHTFTSDADGSFSKSFYIAEPTTYNITITAPDFEDYTSTYQFTPGVNQVQNLQMTPEVETGSISGTIRDSGTLMGLAGGTVTLTAPGVNIVITADANGNYAESDIPVGSYSATGSAPNHISETIAVTINANTNTVQDFNLVVMP